MMPAATDLLEPAAADAGCVTCVPPAVAPMHELPISWLSKHFPAGSACSPPLPARAMTNAPVGENANWRGFASFVPIATCAGVDADESSPATAGATETAHVPVAATV